MLAPLQTPRVEIPKGSWAHDLLRERGSVRTPLGLAAWGGFGDLRKHRLPEGDAEVRIWEGFGLTNLGGLILRRHGGTWTAVRLLGGLPGTKFRSKRFPFPAPKSGWPLFWRKAAGLWSLPDDATLPQKSRRRVLDGMGYLVETQRDGLYRASAHDNPEFQTGWPTARRVVGLARLLDLEFPLPKA